MGSFSKFSPQRMRNIDEPNPRRPAGGQLLRFKCQRLTCRGLSELRRRNICLIIFELWTLTIGRSVQRPADVG